MSEALMISLIVVGTALLLLIFVVFCFRDGPVRHGSGVGGAGDGGEIGDSGGDGGGGCGGD